MRGQMFRFTSSPSCTARWSPQGRSRHQGVVHPVIMGEVLLPNCVAHGEVPIQIVFIVANTAFELSHVFISWSPTQIRTHMHDAVLPQAFSFRHGFKHLLRQVFVYSLGAVMRCHMGWQTRCMKRVVDGLMELN